MNILYISGEDIPGDHGGSIHTWYVARGWARLGHRVTVLCRRRPDQLRCEELDGVTIGRVPMEFRSKKIPLLGIPSLPGLLSGSWDAVVERYDVFGGLGAIIAWAKRLPLLLEVNYPHLEELIWKWRQRRSRFLQVPLLIQGLRWWETWQYRQASGAIATRKDILPESIRDRTWLVHWGADPARFKPLLDNDRNRIRKEMGLNRAPVVLFMGSFRSWHGVEILPDLIDLTRKALPDVRFLLVGDGNGKDAVSKEIADRDLTPWVVFTGNWPHSRMPELLSSADIGIAPYDATRYPPLLEYGFFWSPAKLFEYAACGLPIVCTDYDLLSDIVVDGETGKLIPPGDIQAFSQAIIELCRDSKSRQRMGENGRQRVVNQFSWDHHAKSVAHILEQMVEQRKDKEHRHE